MTSSRWALIHSLFTIALVTAISVTGIAPATASPQVSQARPASMTAPGPETDAGDSVKTLKISPDGSRIYAVGNEALNVFDAKLNILIASIPELGGGTDLIVSPDSSMLYVVSSSGIKVVSAATWKVLGTVRPHPNIVHFDVALSSDGKTLLAVAGYTQRTMYVIDSASMRVVKEIPLGEVSQFFGIWTRPGSSQEAYVAIGSDYDAEGKRSFLAKAINFNTGQQKWAAPACNYLREIEFTPDGSKPYIVCGGGYVMAVSPETGAVTNRIEPFGQLDVAAMSADGRKLLVAGHTWNKLSEIDVATDKVTATVDTSTTIRGLDAPTVRNQVFLVRDGMHGDSLLSAITVGNSTPSVAIDRIAGGDRYETAVAISRTYNCCAHTVYIATGEQFPDALSASGAAVSEHAPLLLTKTMVLPDVVRDELLRLNPSRIVVVGGVGAVSADVFQKLKAMVPDTVRRSGPDRYATARAVISGAFSAAPSKLSGIVSIATGADYPDALSASGAVLLVPPGAKRLDASTMALLKSLSVFRVDIIGGPGVVGTSIDGQLREQLFQVYRFAGTDRFDTNRLVNQHWAQGRSRAYFAAGFNFPDALSISSVAGTEDGAVHLVRQNCIPSGVTRNIGGTTAATRITLVGGPAVISPDVAFGTKC